MKNELQILQGLVAKEFIFDMIILGVHTSDCQLLIDDPQSQFYSFFFFLSLLFAEASMELCFKAV